MYGCGGLPRVFPHLSQVSPLPRCNFHSLKACLEACLILAKCLFCSTFHSINGNFHSLEACLEACLTLAKHVSPLLQFPQASRQEACLILAKSLLCCNFHSLAACLAACLLLAKCLFCSTFHSISTNFHSLEACLEAWTPSKGYPRTHDQHAFKKLPTDTRSAQPWDGTPTIVLHSCTHSCSHSSPVVLHFFIHSGQSYEYGHARPATNSSRHGAGDASPCHFRA